MPSDYANELMGRVGLDTTEWKKGITDIDAGIKHIETGFQATAALMDDWSSSSEGLGKRIDSLNDKLALQKKKLDMLKKAYEEEVQKNGASSKAAEELAKKMYQTQSEIKRTTESINKYSKAAEEAADKSGKFAAKAEAIGSKMESFGGKLTMGVTTPVLAAGTAIYKFSSDLTEAENKTEAVFGYMTDSVKKWAQTSLDSMGMAKSSAYDAVALYGDMATSMEIPTGKAAEMSMRLVELSADLSSFKNISLEQSQNALKGIFTGETESLKNLGIIMTETQLKAYAMKQGFGDTYDTMTQAEKVQLRYNYVLEQSKNAVGDYARTNGEAAGQMRKLPEALKELASSFKENVEPAITPIITTVNKAIIAFGKMDSSTKSTITTVALIAATVGPVVSILGKTATATSKLVNGFKTLKSVGSNIGSVLSKMRNYFNNATIAISRKTKATVTDTSALTKNTIAVNKATFANSKYALSAKSSATSSSAAATGISSIAKAGSSALPVLGLVALALAALYAGIEGAGKKMERNITNRYNYLIETATEELEEEQERITNAMQATEETYTSATKSIQKTYNDRIKSAEKYAEEQTELIKKEQEEQEEAHEQSLKRIEEIRKTKKKAIDDEVNFANSKLKAQIDAIDAEIEAEEKAKQDAENEQKLKELKTAVDAAQNMTDKRNAEKALTEFITELEEKKTEDIRSEQKQSLQNQIQLNNERANAQKDVIDEEFDKEKESLENAYEEYTKWVDDRLEYYSNYVDFETELAQKQYDSELEIATDTYDKNMKHFQDMLDDKQKAYDDYVKKMEKDMQTEIDNITFWDKLFNTNPYTTEYKYRFGVASKVEGWQTPDEVAKSFGKFEPSNSSEVPEAIKKLEDFGFGVGTNAKGTNFWRGGLTRLHEEGGEIYNLPRGTQIIPHDISMQMASAYGRQAAVNDSHDTTNNTTNNSYNYGAQQQVNLFEVDGQRVATVIQPTMSVGLARANRSRERALGRSAVKRV